MISWLSSEPIIEIREIPKGGIFRVVLIFFEVISDWPFFPSAFWSISFSERPPLWGAQWKHEHSNKIGPPITNEANVQSREVKSRFSYLSSLNYVICLFNYWAAVYLNKYSRGLWTWGGGKLCLYFPYFLTEI